MRDDPQRPAMEPPDYVPISMLNQLAYCERRFWLMFVHGEMIVNAPVLQGLQQHDVVHAGGTQRDGPTVLHRRVYLWSDRLRVCGFADLVEEREQDFLPVEYKRGRMGRWLNDQLQLCAQAICLEERTGRPVREGQIFYWRSRRRVTVPMTSDLRERTFAAASRAFQLLKEGRVPSPLEHASRCHDCSLEDVCLPRETKLLTARKRVGR